MVSEQRWTTTYPLSVAMVQCCRCNGSGLCKNCSCVKAGKACIDCQPSKKQRCSNPRQQSVTSPQLQAPQAPTQPQASLQPAQLPQSSSQPAASTASLGSELASPAPQLVPTTSNQLPEFQPACNSPFVWGALDSASFPTFPLVFRICHLLCAGTNSLEGRYCPAPETQPLLKN